MTPIGNQLATRKELDVLGGIWIEQRSPHCDWCGMRFTHFTELGSYLDWCTDLARLLPPMRKHLPHAKVFCADCAGGAISELIDGIKFSPTSRPSTEPEDPWSRPPYRHDAERERYS